MGKRSWSHDHQAATLALLTCSPRGFYAFSLPLLHIRNGADHPKLDNLPITSHKRFPILDVCPALNEQMWQNTDIQTVLAEMTPIFCEWKGSNACNICSAFVQRATERVCDSTKCMGQERRGRFGDRRCWYPEFGLESRQHLSQSQSDGTGIKELRDPG